MMQVMVFCLLNAEASSTSIWSLALIYSGGAVAWKQVSDSSGTHAWIEQWFLEKASVRAIVAPKRLPTLRG